MTETIPEPSIILLGCQPWPPQRQDVCPVCGGRIDAGDDAVHCAWCSASSPRREAQVRAARIGLAGASRACAAEDRAGADLRRATRRQPGLTEVERRRLWNGHRGGILSECAELTNRARIGREFLTRIGQVPDWSLKLGKHGKVIRGCDPAEDA
jgi:hypothetical protein